MRTSKLVLGILTGTVAGVALGILFASQKVVDTIRNITHAGSRHAARMKEKLDDPLNKITRKFNRIRLNISKYKSRIRDKNHTEMH